jgi:hypothetical protein
MCVNAQKTIINLMAEIEPSIIAIGNETGIANNPAFQTVISEYNAALTAVENWKSGTPAQDAIQIITDLQTGLQALQSLIPSNILTLLNIILAGVATVIAVLSANSPAPTPIVTGGDATPEETQAQWQAQVIADVTAKVLKLVPGYKRSIWHSAATQYKNTWNGAVKTGKFPVAMLLA